MLPGGAVLAAPCLVLRGHNLQVGGLAPRQGAQETLRDLHAVLVGELFGPLFILLFDGVDNLMVLVVELRGEGVVE